MKKLILLFTLMMSFDAFAKYDCNKSNTQGEYVDCMYDEVLSPMQVEIYDMYNNQTMLSQEEKENEALLVKANLDWFNYVDKECTYKWKAQGGTSADWGIKFSCIKAKYEGRLNEMKSPSYLE
jgi:uncharacterized protein YecT (DUF1311 family)